MIANPRYFICRDRCGGLDADYMLCATAAPPVYNEALQGWDFEVSEDAQHYIVLTRDEAEALLPDRLHIIPGCIAEIRLVLVPGEVMR